MERFVSVLLIIGVVLLVFGIVVVVQSVVAIIKKRTTVKSFATSLLIFLVSCGFGLAFTSIALFVHTFSRFSHEERIGYVFAEEHGDTIYVTYINEKSDETHFFKLAADQWMIEGHIMRWNKALRWLGVESHFCVTRFSGRDIVVSDRSSIYQLASENSLWRYLLKHSEKIPFVDAAYGIAAFQYPNKEPYYLYINDTGFIIKKR